ncbi:MAG: hypothetical protein CUN55_06520 [Phototrophicales bacterium]|nr:MAG: hypothetical protein CUN55_06520 [Phototrophicales bacterium]
MVLSKRERLEKTIAGEATDRAPVALWRHWPGDDQRPSDLVMSLQWFQQQWDFDFIHIAPSPSTTILDYGAQDAWQGDLKGYRYVTQRPITRSLDWTELPILDPQRGYLGQLLEVMRLMDEAIKGPVPLVMTIYSPLSQAVLLAGETLLLKHLRQSPERLKTGLNTLMSNTLRFLDALQTSRVAGVCYMITHADLQFLSVTEYETFGRVYDLQILETLPSQWWLNIVNVQGKFPMMEVISSYPSQVLAWPAHLTDNFDLASAKIARQGALYGGLDVEQDLHYGTPLKVRDQARHAFELVNNRRLILGTNSPLFVTTPQANIRATREAIDISEKMG